MAPVTQPPSADKKDVASMTTSDAGLLFIFHHEALKGVTEHLHWPGGSSGVTLGAGYDMKERSASQIANDLKSIGVASDSAEKASAGAGLKHAEADDFADDNHDLLSLTQEQQVKLLKQIVPHYEAIVKRNIRVKLSQNEFDALVSFSYNPGGHVTSITHAINNNKVDDAVRNWSARVTTGHKKSQGLVNRRRDEVNLYVRGVYVSPQAVHHHHAGHKHIAPKTPSASGPIRLP
jgi:hypothetical protein